MTDAISAVPIALPGGGNPNSLFFVPVNLGWSDVEQIIIRFPPGCSGLVGVRIEYAVNPVYPIGANSWFTLEDESVTINVTNQPQSGQWRVTGYNSDFYQHTPVAYFFYNYLQPPASSPVSALVSL